MGEAKRKRALVSIDTVSEQEHYAVVSLAHVARAGTPEQFAAVRADFAKIPDCTILEAADVQGGYVARWGPFPTAIGAETRGLQLLQVIDEALSEQRSVRTMRQLRDGGVLADWAYLSINAPPKELAERPRDLDQQVTEARALLARLEDVEPMRLLLAAALKLTDGHDEQAAAFVQRARAIMQWLAAEGREPTPLEQLEWRARALAQLVAENMRPGEIGALVLDNGHGQLTYLSTVDRPDMIRLLQVLLAKLSESLEGP